MGNNKRLIDLGTDARTKPTDAMWEAMRSAGLHPAESGGTNALQELIATARELTGKEAALLLPSCTLANLAALMAHANRGDHVIIEESSHIAWSEGWGIASIAGLYPRTVRGIRGRMNADDVESALMDERFSHKPAVSLLCLENTHNASGGTVLPPSETEAMCTIARARGAAIHMDGARIFNAAAALGQPVEALVRPVDSVAFNLNKGLSAPEGAILCGSEAFIARARGIAKALGGESMHKAGLIAAAGVVALRDMVRQLPEDHRRARMFAEAIQGLAGIQVDMETVQTNMVMADISQSGLDGRTVIDRLMERKVAAYLYQSDKVRFVFHRHINDEDVRIAAQALGESMDRELRI